MKANNRLYTAAWLWQWYLNDAYDEYPGALRKSVRRAFPYVSGREVGIFRQDEARQIHRALKRHPPEVNYETNE